MHVWSADVYRHRKHLVQCHVRRRVRERRAKNPATPKVRHSSFQWFAKIVSSSHSALDPEHDNVRILTDGTIASVYFNFVFLVDGKQENRGSETWQLVNTSNGWKIAAITYSSDPDAQGH